MSTIRCKSFCQPVKGSIDLRMLERLHAPRTIASTRFAIPTSPRSRAGVHPKVMRFLAGHDTSAVTMDIYTHVNMDFKLEDAETLAKAMAAAQPEPE